MTTAGGPFIHVLLRALAPREYRAVGRIMASFDFVDIRYEASSPRPFVLTYEPFDSPLTSKEAIISHAKKLLHEAGIPYAEEQ